VTRTDLDCDALLVRDAARLFVRGETEAAVEVLRKVDPVRAGRPPRRRPGAIPPVLPAAERVRPLRGETALEVFRRDCWRCCYCGRLLVHADVLKLVGQLAGDVFAWVSSNMPMDKTHPAVERLCPNVEHVLPLARGGNNDEHNLRASCTPCNEWKADCTVEEAERKPIPSADGWDGLEAMLGPLRTQSALSSTPTRDSG
jgi:5-methylcytosine-specific restriction endonuclease McrA